MNPEENDDQNVEQNINHQARQYLFDYLIEEFERYEDVRVRALPNQKAPGVTVRTERREYFFPFQWAEEGNFSEVRELVAKIKELL